MSMTSMSGRARSAPKSSVTNGIFASPARISASSLSASRPPSPRRYPGEGRHSSPGASGRRSGRPQIRCRGSSWDGSEILRSTVERVWRPGPRLGILMAAAGSGNDGGNRLAGETTVDPEVIRISRYDLMVAVQLRKPDKAGVGIVHPASIAADKRPHRRGLIGKDRHDAKNAGLDHLEYASARLRRLAEEEARLRDDGLAGQGGPPYPRELPGRPCMPLVVAVEGPHEGARVQDGAKHGRTRPWTSCAGRFARSP